MKSAFTMIEMVFIIVIIGILSFVAIPRINGSIEDANVVVGISTISSIRSAIASQRQRSLILGKLSYPAILDDAKEDVSGEALFDGNKTIDILQYAIYSGLKSGDWMKIDTYEYQYHISKSKTVIFTYKPSSGIFDCPHSEDNCKILAE